MDIPINKWECPSVVAVKRPNLSVYRLQEQRGRCSVPDQFGAVLATAEKDDSICGATVAVRVHCSCVFRPGLPFRVGAGDAGAKLIRHLLASFVGLILPHSVLGRLLHQIRAIACHGGGAIEEYDAGDARAALVHRMGFRFRVHRRDLSGRPDIVLPRLRKVINVHGCFWHMHKSQRRRKPPVNHAEYWRAKRERNVARDRRNDRKLRMMGWRVLTVWECQTRDVAGLAKRLDAFLSGPA